MYLTGAAAEAAACDAMLTPVVTGHIDWAVLDQLTTVWLTLHTHDHTLSDSDSQATGDSQNPGDSKATGDGHGDAGPHRHGQDPGDSHQGDDDDRHDSHAPSGHGHGDGQDPGNRRHGQTSDGGHAPRHSHAPGPGYVPRPGTGHPATPAGPRRRPGLRDPGCLEATRQRLQATIARWSLDLVSGPGGLASCLRGTLLAAPFSTPSQPLDIGRTTRTIPPHLRTAVTLRDQHCQFPRCTQPASVCEVHHLIHWAHDGPTSLPNLILLCRFHHQIAIHRWGWNITRHPDGTTTATAPDGTHPPQPQPTPASRLTSGDTPSRDPVRHDATGNRAALRAWKREPCTTGADGRTLDAIVSWTC